MKQRIHPVIWLFPALFFLGGCVDDNYNLGRLDPEITVLKTGLTYPLGVTYTRRLEEVFELDLYSIVKTDDQGDYYLKYRPSPFDLSVTLQDDGQFACSFNSSTYTCYSFPDALKNDVPDIGLEHSAAEVNLSLESGIPASLTFGLDFELYRQGGARHSFGYDGLPVVPGESNVTVRNADFFQPVPNGVIFREFRVDGDPDQKALVTPGEPYTVKVTPVIQVPLTLTADMEIVATCPISLLYGMVKEIRVQNVIVQMQALNTIPVDFFVSGFLRDGEGHKIEGIQVSADRQIPAGNLSSPAESPLEITILAPEGHPLSGNFVLEMHGRTDASVAGTRINHDHRVFFKDLKVRLPEGVQIDIF
jgi:hypothetical protein